MAYSKRDTFHVLVFFVFALALAPIPSNPSPTMLATLRHSIPSRALTRGFSSSVLRAAPNGKVYPSAAEAVEVVKSNDILLTGGFGLCGIPDTLLKALAERKEVKGLTGVSNNAGVEEKGLGLLLQTKQVSKLIASYVGA
jgi:3-oxoacid CoA-transferase